jgi:2'-5' RNA ligase
MQQSRVLALDLALLLPAGLAAEARRINGVLAIRSGDRTISLGGHVCPPHITLAMAPVPEGKIPEATAVLASAVRRHLPLPLMLSGVSTVATSSGRRVSGFDLAPEEALLVLHRDVMDGLAGLAADEDPVLCTGEGAAPDPAMVAYVRNFARACAHDRYSPHVTLGVGEAEDGDAAMPFPHRFQAGAAAVCHVGNGGTCRRVLAEMQI